MYLQGGWETDEATAAEAASREAYEEGGIRGITGATLSPTHAMSKSETIPVRCEWFVCYVDELLNEWPEGFERSRIVVSLDEAINLVHRPEHRMALQEVITYTIYTPILYVNLHVLFYLINQVKQRRLEQLNISTPIKPKIGYSFGFLMSKTSFGILLIGVLVTTFSVSGRNLKSNLISLLTSSWKSLFRKFGSEVKH